MLQSAVIHAEKLPQSQRLNQRIHHPNHPIKRKLQIQVELREKVKIRGVAGVLGQPVHTERDLVDANPSFGWITIKITIKPLQTIQIQTREQSGIMSAKDIKRELKEERREERKVREENVTSFKIKVVPPVKIEEFSLETIKTHNIYRKLHHSPKIHLDLQLSGLAMRWATVRRLFHSLVKIKFINYYSSSRTLPRVIPWSTTQMCSMVKVYTFVVASSPPVTKQPSPGTTRWLTTTSKKASSRQTPVTLRHSFGRPLVEWASALVEVRRGIIMWSPITIRQET